MGGRPGPGALHGDRRRTGPENFDAIAGLPGAPVQM
jgi:hypothetical protein